MITNEVKNITTDRYGDKIISNFYTQTGKVTSSKYVELMFHMKSDVLNDYMDDNDLRVVMSFEEYHQFLLRQLEELTNYDNENLIFKPIFTGGRWYAQCETIELGRVFLLEKDCNLPKAKVFEDEQSVVDYIKELD